MPQYEVRVLREERLVVEARSTDEAAQSAKRMVDRDPDLKLLGVVRIDLLEPTIPEGQAA